VLNGMMSEERGEVEDGRAFCSISHTCITFLIACEF